VTKNLRVLGNRWGQSDPLQIIRSPSEGLPGMVAGLGGATVGTTRVITIPPDQAFGPDGDLVGVWDSEVPGFFWVAAQGGYGIQTSPAMGEACAALVRGDTIPERIAGFGLTAAMLSPARL